MRVSELEAQLALGTIRFYKDSEQSYDDDTGDWKSNNICCVIPKLSAKGLTYLLTLKQLYAKRHRETLNAVVQAKRFNYTHAMPLIRRKANMYSHSWDALQYILNDAIRDGKIGEIK